MSNLSGNGSLEIPSNPSRNDGLAIPSNYSKDLDDITENSVLIRNTKSSVMSRTLWNTFKFLLVSYFLLLGYTIFGILYPETCQFAKENKNSINYKRNCIEPLHDKNPMVDIALFLSPYSIDNKNKFSSSDKPIWLIRNHSANIPLDASIRIPVPEYCRIKGQTLHGHIVISLYNENMDYSPAASDAIITNILLTELKIPRQRKIYRNLLDTDSTSPSTSTTSSDPLQNIPTQHWKFSSHPLILRYINFNNIILASNYLPYIDERLNIKYKNIQNNNHHQQQQLQQRVYSPILWIDEISLMRHHFIELSNNMSTPNPEIKFQYVPVTTIYYAFKKFCMVFLHMGESFLAEPELDEIKWWLSDDKLFQLIITQAVSIIHITLELLAFQDDWRYFTGRKSYRDILYGLWKCKRVLKPHLTFRNGNVYSSSDNSSSSSGSSCSGFFFSFIPKLSYLEPMDLDSDELYTAKLDSIAVTHVGLCLYPLLLGSALYALLYYKHKSWWSWIVNALVDMVYLSGFISLTPQLYINYKLKSVAHLPLKAFIYKMFNTVIDDIFAVIIKMPLKHRIMTLRDDLVFVVFIYQSRTNEFGFQYEDTTSTSTSLILTTVTDNTIHEDDDEHMTISSSTHDVKETEMIEGVDVDKLLEKQD
eukprot:gene12423-26130_t